MKHINRLNTSTADTTETSEISEISETVKEKLDANRNQQVIKYLRKHFNNFLFFLSY